MSAADATPVLIERERHDKVALLRLADGDRSNPLTPDMIDRLRTHLADREGVAAFVIAARGRNFCSGGDHSILADLSREQLGAYLADFLTLFADVAECPVPVVTAVQGAAVGGGLEVALQADFILAGDDAWFRLPQVEHGGQLGGYTLNALIARTGLGFTRRVSQLGPRIDAAEALRVGLVDAVHSRPELEPAALALAAELASRHPDRLARVRADLAERVGAARKLHGQIARLTGQTHHQDLS